MFLSQTFKAEQKRWSAADKECYAIVFAFKELEHLIRDRYFILRTDHKNLTYINLENSGKVRRWKLLLQEYNCGVEHIIGVFNFVADDFSRMIPHVRKEDVTNATIPSVVSTTIDVDLSNPAASGPMEEETDDVQNNTTTTTSSTPSHTTTSTQVEEDEVLPLFMATLICAPILEDSQKVPRDNTN
jgi:hypothetical protein